MYIEVFQKVNIHVIIMNKSQANLQDKCAKVIKTWDDNVIKKTFWYRLIPYTWRKDWCRIFHYSYRTWLEEFLRHVGTAALVDYVWTGEENLDRDDQEDEEAHAGGRRRDNYLRGQKTIPRVYMQPREK